MTDVRTRRSSAATREHVLAVTTELFYWQGIRATGIDKIAATAGVAPTTLYRLFASKDDLVRAYLETSEVGYLGMVDGAVGSAGGARDRVLALFRELVLVTDPAGFRGCPFLMALAEFPEPAHPAHVQALRTKAAVRDRMRRLAGELAAEGAVADPDGLADQLMLVMEGVYGAVQAHGDLGPARQAPAVAEALLDAARGQARP